MPTMTKSAQNTAKRDRYLELVLEFPLRPLVGNKNLRRAQEIAATLRVKAKLSRDERDYLEVLGDLIEKYEDRGITIEPVADGEMITFLLGLKKVTQSVAARETGIPSSVLSNVLHGKRRLNRGQIGKLAAYFGVDPTVFDFNTV